MPTPFEQSIIVALTPVEGSDNLAGAVEIFGVRHWVDAIRVEMNDDDELAPTNDSQGRFENLCSFMDGIDGFFRTVSIPGRDGEFVLSITPTTD